MEGQPFIVRRAQKQDASAILECHRAAIREKASSFYDQKTIDVWSSGVSVERVEQEIANPGWIYIVAVDAESVIGMGIVVPKDHALRAVYVRPNPYEQVGTKILGELLVQTKAANCIYLEADSSINAERFYIANGFRILSRGMHRMNNGDEMACVKMRIDLN